MLSEITQSSTPHPPKSLQVYSPHSPTPALPLSARRVEEGGGGQKTQDVTFLQQLTALKCEQMNRNPECSQETWSAVESAVSQSRKQLKSSTVESQRSQTDRRLTEGQRLDPDVELHNRKQECSTCEVLV